ncbi:hypothetical protein Tco_1368377 [Tanacetum coccineum]
MATATEALIAAIADRSHDSVESCIEIPSPPLLLPSTTHRDDIPKADMPLRKRARFTTPTSRFEVGECSAAIAARQPRLDVDTLDANPGLTMSKDVGYGITDVWDDMVRDMEGRAPTTLEELSQRVTYLAATLARDTHEMYVRFEDAEDDRALLRAQVNMLFSDKAVHADLLAYRAEVKALHKQISVLQSQRNEDSDRLTQHIQQGHDRTREPELARDPEPHDGPADAGSSCWCCTIL